MVLRPDFIRRLESLETRIAGQPPAGPSDRGLGKLMLLLLAWYEGQMEERESVMMALQRALRFDRMADLNEALKPSGYDEFNRRYAEAMKRLLAKGGLTPESVVGEKFAPFFGALIEGLPPGLMERVGLDPRGPTPDV
jgi:hypothetical protein